MQAAVCRAFGAPLSIEEVTLAPPGPGEVEARLAACAICHSDIHLADGAWGGPLPAVYGHEAAGVVSRVGPGVTTLQPGNHVVVTLIRSCGTCCYCSRGRDVACEAHFARDQTSPLADVHGAPVAHGMHTAAFADSVVVDASQVVAIDPDVPLDAASLLACGVITGFGAVVNDAAVTPGAHVAVIGAGGVGLNCIQAAALQGAASVIAIDVMPGKLDDGRAFGATHGLDGRDPALPEQLRALTGGRGADYVLVTVGAEAAIARAFDLLAKAGTLVVVGMPAAGVMAEFDPTALAASSQRIVGSRMGSARIRDDIPRLVELYRAGRLELEALISARYPLARINEAIAATKSGKARRNVIVFEEPGP